MNHRPLRHALLTAAVALSAAAVLLAAPVRGAGPWLPLAFAHGPVTSYVVAETYCWNGTCADAGAIVTLAEPLTVPLGAGLVLAPSRASLRAPDAITVTRHRAADLERLAAEGTAARWRSTGPGVVEALAPIAPLRHVTYTLPAVPGAWVLEVRARWSGDPDADVRWGVRVDTTDGPIDRTYDGLYQRGRHVDLFVPGGAMCPYDGPAWDLTICDGEHDCYGLRSPWLERYDAVTKELTGGERASHWDDPPVEVRFQGRRAPAGGQYNARDAHPRIVVTALEAMTATLRCGMDAPDLALAAATVADVGCIHGTHYERFVARVTNIGTQPAVPFAVEAWAGNTAGEVIRWEVGPLAVGAEVVLTATRQMRMGDPPVTSFRVDVRDEVAERFDVANNHRENVARPRTRNERCPLWAGWGGGRRVFVPVVVRGIAAIRP